MKTITILSLCLTASLSFANSEILDKTKDDAFTYNDSGLCDGIPNCYSSMKNLPEIDDNSRFPPMPLRVGESVSACGASFGSNFSFVIAGDDRYIINSNKKIDEYEAIYNKYSTLGFSSEANANANANAYFNIYILNNTPNNQLGYLRWRTYKFSNSIKSYIINFGATITEQAALLFPLDQSSISFDIYDLSEFQCSNSELITRIHGNPCPIEYSNKILKKYGLLTQADTVSYDYSKLCNDSINCQFIKRSDICDRSSHVFSSYDIHTEFSDKCKPYKSYLPLELLGFSSESDANINIQLFDSPAVLKEKQNHPTKIKHDF